MITISRSLCTDYIWLDVMPPLWTKHSNHIIDGTILSSKVMDMWFDLFLDS